MFEKGGFKKIVKINPSYNYGIPKFIFNSFELNALEIMSSVKSPTFYKIMSHKLFISDEYSLSYKSILWDCVKLNLNFKIVSDGYEADNLTNINEYTS